MLFSKTDTRKYQQVHADWSVATKSRLQYLQLYSKEVFMAPVLRILANGMAALGSPLITRGYPVSSRTPFSDDRQRLLEDYRRVERDLRRSIDKVKKENASETHRR